MIAAYNAGEAAVIKYNWNIPPYPETMNYVYQVGKRLGDARRLQKKNTSPKVETAQLQVPSTEEMHRPVEAFVDSEGKLYLRTR